MRAQYLSVQFLGTTNKATQHEKDKQHETETQMPIESRDLAI